MKKLLHVSAPVLLLAIASAPVNSARQGVPYPEGYRTWVHVKSMIIKPSHPLADPFAGIHHVYANARALKGLQTGNYEKGAMFVFDLLEVRESKSAIEEGKRKLIGVMLYDPQAYDKTGGWGFEGFAGNSRTKRLVKDGGAGCFGCHEQARKTHHVFTTWRP